MCSTYVKEFLGVFMFGLPAISAHFSLVFLRFQANSELVPKIPSCFCLLLIYPSKFKFINFTCFL
jgi:hypothetical protein